MTETEIQVLQAEVAALKQEKEALTGSLAARDGEISTLRQDVAGLRQQVTAVTADLAEAVSGYRTMAVKANPETPAELITGDTISAVNQAIDLAGLIVRKVREKLDSARSLAKVPPGAPGRTPPDFSFLPPREKIRRGINRPRS